MKNHNKKEYAKNELQELIDSFEKENHETMNEANTKSDFIHNFFAAFG